MPRFSIWTIRAALLYLATGFTLGALLLWNKGVTISPQIWRLLSTHIEFLIFGWTLQLVMGVAFWILPGFADHLNVGMNRSHGWRPVCSTWGSG